MTLSALHEGILALFRNRPSLATELLGLAGGVVPPHSELSIVSADFSEANAVESRADLVLRLTAKSGPGLIVIVEAQLAAKPEKRFAWPQYAAAARSRFRCPCEVLVVTPRASIARWAAKPIRLGGRFVFYVTVVGPDAVPWVDDATAQREPELAVLSVMAHGATAAVDSGVKLATAAMNACAPLDEARAALYYDLILTSLSRAARSQLEKLMPGYQYQSDFAKKYFAMGREEGREQGREEGREQGREEGLALAVLRVLESRALRVEDADRERILACHDVEQLERWIGRAATVDSVSALFE